MLSTLEWTILLVAHATQVCAAIVTGWRMATVKHLPCAALVFAVLVGLGALNDSLTLLGVAFQIKTSPMLRGQIYTVVEFTAMALFTVFAVRNAVLRWSALASVVVFVGIVLALYQYGLQSVSDFDNFSAGISALGIIVLMFSVVWSRAKDITYKRHWRWLLVLCLLVAGSSLLDFTVYFTYNTLKGQGDSMWWVHHLVAMIKFTGVSYCYWRML